VFLQIRQLLIREAGRLVMAIVGVVCLQDGKHRCRSAIVEVGGATLDFGQCRGVQGLILVQARSRAHVVAFLVGQPLAAMTGRAAGVCEDLLPSPGGVGQTPLTPIGAFDQGERFEVFINCLGVILGAVGELDELLAGAHCRFGRLANGQAHHGRRAVRQQETSRVVRVAQAVVGEVPVEAVGPAIRMTARAALPLLEAQAGVVEQEFAATPDPTPMGSPISFKPRRFKDEYDHNIQREQRDPVRIEGDVHRQGPHHGWLFSKRRMPVLLRAVSSARKPFQTAEKAV